MNYSFDHVLLLGDTNADFLRCSGHVKGVSELLSNSSLVGAWDILNADFSYIHVADGATYLSLIDHFVWNAQSTVLKCGVLHLLGNTSDHCPIFCEIKVCNI